MATDKSSSGAATSEPSSAAAGLEHDAWIAVEAVEELLVDIAGKLQADVILDGRPKLGEDDQEGRA